MKYPAAIPCSPLRPTLLRGFMAAVCRGCGAQRPTDAVASGWQGRVCGTCHTVAAGMGGAHSPAAAAGEGRGGGGGGRRAPAPVKGDES